MGVAYRPPVTGLQLTGVYTLTRYSVYTADTFVGDKGTTIDVPRKYGDGHTFRVGAEYDVDPRLTLRGGVLRDLSGLKTDTYSPTLPDVERLVGAVGRSWKVRSEPLACTARSSTRSSTRWRRPGRRCFRASYDSERLHRVARVTWRTDLGAAR